MERAAAMAGGEKLGVILFAHGSTVEEANQGVHDLAARVGDAGRFHFVRAAFLDCVRPTLGDAIAEAVAAGVDRIVVIPYFLTMGIHLRRDLPDLIEPERVRHPQVTIEVGQSLEGHPSMSSIILKRVEQVMAAGDSRNSIRVKG
jgi:sirohydrochlorin ferrochelatase